MIRKPDTLGVFLIESRAEMAMLPTIKPHTFYDLVNGGGASKNGSCRLDEPAARSPGLKQA
jgi:hypothetical protein